MMYYDFIWISFIGEFCFCVIWALFWNSLQWALDSWEELLLFPQLENWLIWPNPLPQSHIATRAQRVGVFWIWAGLGRVLKKKSRPEGEFGSGRSFERYLIYSWTWRVFPGTSGISDIPDISGLPKMLLLLSWMVMMMRKKKILLEWCAGPQDSPHCAYIAQARTHRGYGVCIDYIHCSQKLSQGHYQGGRNCGILASGMGGNGDRKKNCEGKCYQQGLKIVFCIK